MVPQLVPPADVVASAALAKLSPLPKQRLPKTTDKPTDNPTDKQTDEPATQNRPTENTKPKMVTYTATHYIIITR